MISPIEAIAPAIDPAATAVSARPQAAASFGQMLINGVEEVDQKLVEADATARAFVLGDAVPPHQVTFALEEARLSLELMLQVRARLVEGYQEIMRMQL